MPQPQHPRPERRRVPAQARQRGGSAAEYAAPTLAAASIAAPSRGSLRMIVAWAAIAVLLHASIRRRSARGSRRKRASSVAALHWRFIRGIGANPELWVGSKTHKSMSTQVGGQWIREMVMTAAGERPGQRGRWLCGVCGRRREGDHPLSARSSTA